MAIVEAPAVSKRSPHRGQSGAVQNALGSPRMAPIVDAQPVLVVYQGSLASRLQIRKLLRVTKVMCLPRVVLLGDGCCC